MYHRCISGFFRGSIHLRKPDIHWRYTWGDSDTPCHPHRQKVCNLGIESLASLMLVQCSYIIFCFCCFITITIWGHLYCNFPFTAFTIAFMPRHLSIFIVWNFVVFYSYLAQEPDTILLSYGMVYGYLECPFIHAHHLPVFNIYFFFFTPIKSFDH